MRSLLLLGLGLLVVMGGCKNEEKDSNVEDDRCQQMPPTFAERVLLDVTTEIAWQECDLSGKNLRDRWMVKGNLSHTNLSGADLTGAQLANADLTEATLNNANLVDAHLVGANLSGANLSGANLSGANLDWADLSDASLMNANLTGAEWSYVLCPDGTPSADHNDSCCGHLNGAVPAAGCD